MKTQDQNEKEKLPRTSKLRFDEAVEKANLKADKLIEELKKPFKRQHVDFEPAK